MSFDSMEIVSPPPEETSEERRRRKISEAARKRRRRKDGTFCKPCGRGSTKNRLYTNSLTFKGEYKEMVFRVLKEAGVPMRRVGYDPDKRLLTLNIPARGYPRARLLLRNFYTEMHIKTWLYTWLRWNPEVVKGGRGKKARLP